MSAITDRLIAVERRLEAIDTEAHQASVNMIVALEDCRTAQDLAKADLDTLLLLAGELAKLKVEAEGLLKERRKLRAAH